MQCIVFVSEKFLFGPAVFFPFPCMHIESIWRYRNRVQADIFKPFFHIRILAVIDEILQMVRITALAALAQKNYSLADKNAPPRFGLVLVGQLMALPKSLDLFGDDPVAVLGTDCKQTFPYIVVEIAGPKLKGEIPCDPGISAPDGFLHSRTNLEKVISVYCFNSHNFLF